MTASNFPTALREILRQEGGYVDDPRDNGGATNLGVTLQTARENGLDMDRDGDVDKADVRNLSDAAVSKLYRAKFWNACECDKLPSGLDLMVFDLSVNSGPTRARRMLQQALGVTVDGVLGPKTLDAAQRADTRYTIEQMRMLRERFYRSLADFQHFGNGWLRRLAGVYAASLYLAGVRK